MMELQSCLENQSESESGSESVVKSIIYRYSEGNDLVNLSIFFKAIGLDKSVFCNNLHKSPENEYFYFNKAS